MKRIILIAIALAVICSENGYARDKDGNMVARGKPSCREFHEGNATAKFKDPRTVDAVPAFLKYRAWISGYLTAYNQYVFNGKSSVLGAANMSDNDGIRWIGAWCRDNMSKDVFNAIQALTSKID